jgi:hypothetical protein
MKTTVSLTFFLFFCLNINCVAQNERGKITLFISSGYSLLGDEDYNGFLCTNSIRFNIIKHIQISESFGCNLSSNNGEKNLLLTHSSIHILNDLSFVLLPFDTKKFKVGFNMGGSLRYRSEINTIGYSEINGVITLKYSNSDSVDLGYFGQVELGFSLSQKIFLFLLAGMHSYKNGSGISSTGLGLSLKL